MLSNCNCIAMFPPINSKSIRSLKSWPPAWSGTCLDPPPPMITLNKMYSFQMCGSGGLFLRGSRTPACFWNTLEIWFSECWLTPQHHKHISRWLTSTGPDGSSLLCECHKVGDCSLSPYCQSNTRNRHLICIILDFVAFQIYQTSFFVIHTMIWEIRYATSTTVGAWIWWQKLDWVSVTVRILDMCWVKQNLNY